MANLSNYAENKIIDHIFRGRQWTAPVTLYAALFTAPTDDAGGGTEVAGGGYARVAITCSDANWNATQGGAPAAASSGTSGATANANAITFPAPTGNWGQVTHAALYDAPAAGNQITHGPLTTPKTVNNGDPAPSFTAGALGFTIG